MLSVDPWVYSQNVDQILFNYHIYSCNEQFLIFSPQKGFLSYIACNEQLLTFSHANLQKYFTSTFKHLFKLSKQF